MPTSMVCNDLDLFFVLIFSCFSLLDRVQTHPKYRMGSIPLIFTVADFAIAFLLGILLQSIVIFIHTESDIMCHIFLWTCNHKKLCYSFQ